MGYSATKPRRKTQSVKVGNITVGGGAPVVVQSMTNTDTANVDATVAQIIELARAGSELVRVTVDKDEAAAAIPRIREKLDAQGFDTPIIGDFHYIGHTLLRDHPDCAAALAKYRINPGNVGFKDKQDRNFSMMIEQAIAHNKPVRIGVNWGSLDQMMVKKLLDENLKTDHPKDVRLVMHEAMVQSGISSAKRAQEIGLGKDKIIISTKVSEVQDLIACYRMLSERADYALHLGLTEAGMGSKGIVGSTAGLAVLLQEGIGDTIRISLTPEPGGDRAREVIVAQEILQTMGLRSFKPMVISCPGCGRTTSSAFQELGKEVEDYILERTPHWREKYPGFETLQLAVMGCIVNGPGESKHADIGISLPGTGEVEAVPLFLDGKKVKTLRGDDIPAQFKKIVEDYIVNRWG